MLDIVQMPSESNSVGIVHSQLEFRQLDYLWLFDPFIRFRDRSDLKLEDHQLSLEDYEQMRKVNRAMLTIFLSQLQEGESLKDTA